MHNAPPGPLALRRGVLAASVLFDIPVQPADDGVRVGASWDDSGTWMPVGWAELAAAVGTEDPESTTGRLRLRDWLRARAWATTLPPAVPLDGRGLAGAEAGDLSRLVALALPAASPLHPGESWVVERVPGGVLDVGAGLRPPDGGLAAPLPPSAVPADRLDLPALWPGLRERVEALAVLAAERLDPRGHSVLQPCRGCDVLTLLTAAALRAALVTGVGAGMRAVAVPMRSRGWFDLARIDPAFVGAAAMATAPEERGVPTPLLVTADEVTVVPRAADPARLARACLR